MRVQGLEIRRHDPREASDVIDQDGEMEVADGRGDVLDRTDEVASEGICDGDTDGAVWILAVQVRFEPCELDRVAAVKDDVESTTAELLGEAEANPATGACHEGPGVGAVEVAWK